MQKNMAAVRMFSLVFMVATSTHGAMEGSINITTKIHQSTTHAEHKQNYTSDLNSNHKTRKTYGHEIRQRIKVQHFPYQLNAPDDGQRG
jgi:hypothetical protein